jgi:hypothetical protein
MHQQVVYINKEYSMATTLYFVQSDTLPQIKLTLTDEVTNGPRNLTGKKVSLHAKPSTGTGVAFTREASLDLNGTDRVNGIAYIVWQDGDLNRPAGTYTAEIEIFEDSTRARETVYETLNLVIREDIADIPASSAPTLPPPASPFPPPNATPGG